MTSPLYQNPWKSSWATSALKAFSMSGWLAEESCSFLDQGLIDEFIISFIPINLGAGIPLFPSPSAEQKLQLIGSKSYESGVLEVHYKTITRGS